jgi:hypothetical protein
VTVTTRKRNARVAGILYILLGVLAPVRLMYVPNAILARGDPVRSRRRRTPRRMRSIAAESVTAGREPPGCVAAPVMRRAHARSGGPRRPRERDQCATRARRPGDFPAPRPSAGYPKRSSMSSSAIPFVSG